MSCRSRTVGILALIMIMVQGCVVPVPLPIPIIYEEIPHPHELEDREFVNYNSDYDLHDPVFKLIDAFEM